MFELSYVWVVGAALTFNLFCHLEKRLTKILFSDCQLKIKTWLSGSYVVSGKPIEPAESENNVSISS